MTEVQMKKLALEIIKDPQYKHDSREKVLSRAILAFFDPEFFIRDARRSEARIHLQEVK